VTDYGLLFRELAVPRLVGTANHQKVREVLKRELATRGLLVEEHGFSGRPRRPLVGVPSGVSGINLIAQRPSDRPTVWLVAHYDSKGQPISMAVRLAAAFVLFAGVVGMIVGAIPPFVVLLLGFLLALNRVNDNSPGAVDNATALIAVFMAIDQLGPTTAVGVIFSDAEEFGLVGARALATERTELFADATVINLDGLDDVGQAIALVHRPGPTGIAVATALQARRWRWLPVVVDGIALARVSRECVTILKGNWRTMRVVHRPTDTVDRVRLDGAASVAAGLARVLRTP